MISRCHFQNHEGFRKLIDKRENRIRFGWALAFGILFMTLSSCTITPITPAKVLFKLASGMHGAELGPIFDFRKSKENPYSNSRRHRLRSYKTKQFIPPPMDEEKIDMSISEAEEKTKTGLTEKEVIALFGERRVISRDGNLWEYYIFPKSWDGDVWILAILFENGKVVGTKKSVAGRIPKEFKN
jgi:hypothetical protein